VLGIKKGRKDEVTGVRIYGNGSKAGLVGRRVPRQTDGCGLPEGGGGPNLFEARKKRALKRKGERSTLQKR